MKRIIMAACIVSLAACGGDKDDVATDQKQEWEAAKASLVYSFPDDGQQQVPTSSPVVLRFSSPVVVTQAALMDLIELRDDEGELVDWDRAEEADGGQSWLLYPESNLDWSTDYQLSIAKIDLKKGDAEARQLSFSTRAAYEGPKSLVAEEEFRILRTLPNDMMLRPDSAPLDVLEFTTFRIQFSQPLERASVIYGNGSDATVQLTGPNGLVDAHVIVSGPYMTIDPKGDLQADAPHKITFTTGLASIYGDTMPGGSFGNPNDTIAQTIDFTPKATGPRASMVQDIAKTPGKPSELTGRQINEVPMASVLLGPDTATQASGIVTAELAFVPDFPDATPLRVKRGSLIEGATIDPVLIGGEVPAGFESGTVRMDFLSDATGYLLPNPYSDADDAPRQVRLWMDVAVSTATPQANGAVTQDLLHIELVGTSLVDPETKRMTINAVGVVEPNVLGSERATGLLSFYMEEVADQDNPPVVVDDNTPPVLQSWMPGHYSPEMPENEYGDVISWLQQPSAPIILNFSEALDPESLRQPGALTLTKDEVSVDFVHKLDGAAVVIQPESGFQYSTVESNPEYTIQLGSQITDLLGNNFVPEILTFKLPGKVTKREVPQNNGNYAEQDVQINSPMLLSAYPGYPCVTDPADRDLAGGFVGRCAGGPGDWPNEDYPLVAYQQDDNLPLMALPANRPIILQFTKEIDAASVKLGGSFDVTRVNELGEPIDEDGNVTINPQPITGDLTVEGQKITFVPNDPWVAGQYYKYVLGSNNNQDPASTGGNDFPFIGSADAVCDGSESICCVDGHPLRTQPLGITLRTPIVPNDVDGTFKVVADYMIKNEYFISDGGGPDLAIFFKGEDPSRNILQTMRSAPDVDVNGNMIHDVDAVSGKLETLAGINPPYYNTEAINRVAPPLPDGSKVGARYPLEEALPSLDDLNSDPLYDPAGLQGLPNSAKILSMNTRGSDLPWMADGADLGNDDPMMMRSVNYALLYSVDGANVGCGYDDVYHPVTDEPGYDFNNDFLNIMDYLKNSQFTKSEPTACPEKKFTYIKTGLAAVVTDEYVPGQGLRVEIYPSQSISSSFVTYARGPSTGQSTLALPSGEQIMRMRYAKDEPSCVDSPSQPCRRTSPITGWIKEGEDGWPMLTAEVDLYIDAPYIGALMNTGLVSLRHNLRSYQATMSLSGPIAFLDDGRMVIKQRNNNPIDIDVKLYFSPEEPNLFMPAVGTAAGQIPYRIPENGIFLQLVSEPNKALN